MRQQSGIDCVDGPFIVILGGKRKEFITKHEAAIKSQLLEKGVILQEEHENQIRYSDVKKLVA